MASNQTIHVENLKQLIRNWFTEMLQVLEAYGDSYNIDDFINNFFLEDQMINEQLQESMENLQQQMQENGLDDVPWFLVYFSSRKVVKYKTWNQLDN